MAEHNIPEAMEEIRIKKRAAEHKITEFAGVIISELKKELGICIESVEIGMCDVTTINDTYKNTVIINTKIIISL